MTRAALLGLEPRPGMGGWLRHAVDAQQDTSKGGKSWTALCGAILTVRPIVGIMGPLDLTCDSCLARWLANP